jgi:hypothetical protein
MKTTTGYPVIDGILKSIAPADMRLEPAAGERESLTTPRPWQLGASGDKCARNHAVCSGPTVIAKVYGKGYPVGEGWSPRSEADAQLIVTAVNHHDALVAVLEAMRKQFSRHTCKYHGPMICDKCEALKAAGSALATIRQ